VAQLFSLGIIAHAMNMRVLLYFVAAGTIGLVILIVSYFSFGPVSNSRLQKLEVGMTTNEIVAILGKPQQVFYFNEKPKETNDGFPDMSLEWMYESPYHFFAEEVFFDRQGRYTIHWKD